MKEPFPKPHSFPPTALIQNHDDIFSRKEPNLPKIDSTPCFKFPLTDPSKPLGKSDYDAPLPFGSGW